jgi:8-oxo-dGDP phosphatase
MHDVVLKNRKEAYKNQWISLREDTYVMDGKEGFYAVVDRPSCMVALPISTSGKTVLLKHFRYAIHDISWEFPMGSKDPVETDEEGAKRELLEEVSLTPTSMEYVGFFYPAPGLLSQKAIVYKANVLDESLVTVSTVDKTEDIEEIKIVSLEDIPYLIGNGTITDGVSISAYYLYMQTMKK